MKNIAEEYALALYELCKESKCEESVLYEMREIVSALKENPDYVKLLDSPVIECQTRTELAEKAFSGVGEYLYNFIMILVEAKRFSHFCDCVDALSRIYDEKHNILRASAVTASPLDEKQSEEIKAKLEKKTNKTVILTNEVDKAIIGGVLLKYGGEQIDRSIRTSLKSIKNMISQADI